MINKNIVNNTILICTILLFTGIKIYSQTTEDLQREFTELRFGMFIHFDIMTFMGAAGYAIDGINDRYYYSVWQSSAPLPQSITIDLGKNFNDISTLYYVPKYKTVTTPTNEGSIKSYKIYASADNINFTEITSGEWNGDSSMKVVSFPPICARYIRLEAITSSSDYAVATEIEVGKAATSEIDSRQGIILPRKFILEQNYPHPFITNALFLQTIGWNIY